MGNPKISVLMSVYNGEKYLRELVESILNQTYKNFEFIIINDGSTDNTLNILKGYNDSRIKIYSQENIGLTKSLNKAIRLSKGKYIARVDVDDIATPRRLEKQIDFLNSNPEIGLVGSFGIKIDKVGQTIQKIILPVFDKKIRKELIKANVFIHGSVMVRKEIFEKVGYYNEIFKYAQDYELWGRIAQIYKLHNLPEVLLIRRETKDSLSSNPAILEERILLSIKAQLSVMRRLRAPFYSRFFLWNLILHFLLYRLKIVQFPLRSKWDLLKIFKWQGKQALKRCGVK